MSAVVIISLGQRGYTEESEKIKLTLQAGFVAAIALLIVYGGLAYLGSTVAHQFKGINPNDINQTALIVNITGQLLGQPGKVVLALIVGLACLTTSIGLVSATAQFFAKISKGMIKYETVVFIVCIFSAVVSNFGVSAIIAFAEPILTIIYPATIVLVLMTLFDNKIKNDNAFKGATYMALIVSVLTVLDSMGANILFIHKLPFDTLGFNWIVPAIIGGILGSFIPSKKAIDCNNANKIS